MTWAHAHVNDGWTSGGISLCLCLCSPWLALSCWCLPNPRNGCEPERERELWFTCQTPSSRSKVEKISA